MDPREILREIFPNKTFEVIDNIISIVEESSTESSDIKLETMIDLLSHTGTAHHTEESHNQSADDDQRTEPEFLDDDELLDEAAGVDVIQVLREFFGDDDVYTSTYEKLLDLLPDADPSYLSDRAEELNGNEVLITQFIENAFEKKDYPTREEYLKQENVKKEEREKKKARMQYISNFRLQEFIKEYPDGAAHFLDPKRTHSLANQTDKEPELIKEEEDYALDFLTDWFCYQRKSDILKIFNRFEKDVIKTSMRLRKIPNAFKEPRQLSWTERDLPSNVPLLKEIAFIRHQEEIEKAIQLKKENLKTARELGVLKTCCICYFDELLPEECFVCNKGCIFCKDCIKNGIEVVIADAKTDMGCLSDCKGDFSLTTLQMVLDPKLFTHFWQKKQLAEIEKAQVDGLEYCLQCYKFATIPDPSDKIFHCDVCEKDTCRECKHEAHIPLKCREIEYDEDVKMRTYIENKMTEALVRKCYRCSKPYLKSSGCNKISCDCGAKMCYLCGAQIANYDHFGDNRCALFTDDNVLHIQNVKQGAARAKQELGVDKNPQLLKFDPSVNI